MDQAQAGSLLASTTREGQRCGRQLLLPPGVLGSVAPQVDPVDQPGVGSRVLLGLQKLRGREQW